MENTHIKRLRAGFLIAVVGFSSLISGGIPFACICAILSWFWVKELLSLAKNSELQPLEIILRILCPGCALAAIWSKDVLDGWLAFSCVAIFCVFVARSFYGPKIKGNLSDIAVSFFCLIYVGWLPAHIVLLRFLESSAFSLNPFSQPGLFYTFFSVASVILNDVGSYYAGKTFGKTKLAEAISPNKTIKGSIGGILAGITMSMLICYFIAPLFHLKLNLWIMFGISILIAVLAQIGDLAESLMKRSMGVKDTSELIEGHGGVLDRFDSHIVVASLMYYFFLSRIALIP
jgi:phosphatidate cytidylyltransferase